MASRPGRLRRLSIRLPAAFYTILILPHARTRFRKLHLSRNFVLAMTLLTGALAAAGLFSPHLLFRLQTQEAAIAALSEENESLRHEKDSIEQRLTEIAARLEDAEGRAGQLASVLGVDDLPTSRPAAGGPSANAPAPRTSLLDGELGALRSRADQLDASLDRLGAAFDDRMRQLASTPSILPTTGWFSHGYGWRKDPFTGERQFHRGVDIVADPGTPIVAAADGIVSQALRVADYGKMIDVSHGFGYVTRYGHMSEILVRPGQRVRRGETIGRVGSTGRSTGPHLHYEIFRDGRRVNPWKYLGQAGS